MRPTPTTRKHKHRRFRLDAHQEPAQIMPRKNTKTPLAGLQKNLAFPKKSSPLKSITNPDLIQTQAVVKPTELHNLPKAHGQIMAKVIFGTRKNQSKPKDVT